MTLLIKPLSRDDQLQDENLNSDENGSSSNIPQMPNIDVTSQGVKKLIDGLDSKKVPESDSISPRPLKLVPNETAHFLEVIILFSNLGNTR